MATGLEGAGWVEEEGSCCVNHVMHFKGVLHDEYDRVENWVSLHDLMAKIHNPHQFEMWQTRQLVTFRMRVPFLQ